MVPGRCFLGAPPRWYRTDLVACPEGEPAGRLDAAWIRIPVHVRDVRAVVPALQRQERYLHLPGVHLPCGSRISNGDRMASPKGGVQACGRPWRRRLRYLRTNPGPILGGQRRETHRTDGAGGLCRWRHSLAGRHIPGGLLWSLANRGEPWRRGAGHGNRPRPRSDRRRLGREHRRAFSSRVEYRAGLVRGLSHGGQRRGQCAAGAQRPGIRRRAGGTDDERTLFYGVLH